MIKVENVVINNREFRKTYSDEGYYIQKKETQEVYSEAIDVLNKNYEYVETDKKIENRDEETPNNIESN